MSGAIKIYTYCTEEDKESGLGVKNRRAGRCEGTQELRCSTVARPRDQIFAALSRLRQLQPANERDFRPKFSNVVCAVCAAGTRCSGSKIRPGAALLHCERYCVREERALLHSWARWPVHRAALHIVRHGTVRCRAAVQSGVQSGVQASAAGCCSLQLHTNAAPAVVASQIPTHDQLQF